MSQTATPARRTFKLFLIKPSHYDDDGYVIQWLRSAIPSNTLAALYGLAADCRGRRVLGEDVDIDITAFDETNTRIRPERIAARHRRGRRAGHGRHSWACSPTSFRARWTSRGRCARPGSRCASAGSMCPAASRCCRRCPPS